MQKNKAGLPPYCLSIIINHHPVRIPLFPRNKAGKPNLPAILQMACPALCRFPDHPPQGHKYTRMAFICIFASHFLLSCFKKLMFPEYAIIK
jgi:hypothetical protein